MLRVVNPHHWLDERGDPPLDNARIRRQVLRIARLIEYGGPLASGESRETLVECSMRPGRKPCPGLLWVVKVENDDIYCYCMSCKRDEVLIHDWQDTIWAEGMMEPVPPEPERPRSSQPN